MIKIITIIGARPQFIKAAMISKAVAEHNSKMQNIDIEEKIIHTGQHYDENMSDLFFNQLSIPKPAWNLNCGSGSHAEMTAFILTETERILLAERPDYVLVYGDTNSTLAGALAAAKLNIPVIHVEAGLRSFNRRMPEEINRILTDHVAELLFCPTRTAIENLKNEGITNGVHKVGDVMYDAAVQFGRIAEKQSHIINDLDLNPKNFYLCTVHRAENTDSQAKLTSILLALANAATKDCPVILPLHPRTRQVIEKYELTNILSSNPNLRTVPPLGFLDMIVLEKNARAILTDSGGVQKEAYFHRTPCVTLREETEWVETVRCGWNQLVGADTDKILQCLKNSPIRTETDEYGNGDAAREIVEIISKHRKHE
jgi:UDP-GlcNAc3NAcA epimerase